MGENCPFAFRRPGDPNVLCRKLQERPNIRWIYCDGQYDCRVTGRWEAPKNANQCKFRKEGKQRGNDQY